MQSLYNANLSKLIEHRALNIEVKKKKIYLKCSVLIIKIDETSVFYSQACRNVRQCLEYSHNLKQRLQYQTVNEF